MLAQCTTAAEVIANYRAVRERTSRWRPKLVAVENSRREYNPQVVEKPIIINDMAREWAAWIIAHQKVINNLGKHRPTVKEIQQVVMRRYFLSEVDLLGRGHSARLVRPRHIAMYLCTRHTLRSLPDIGRQFGGRDHSTTWHAREKISVQRLQDARLDADIAELETLLGVGK